MRNSDHASNGIHTYSEWPYAKHHDNTVAGERIGAGYVALSLLQFIDDVALSSVTLIGVLEHKAEGIVD